MKSLLTSLLLAGALFLSGCGTTNPHRVVLNSTDSIVTAVNLAEKAWAAYTVSTAKSELQAAGIPATADNLRAKIYALPQEQQIERLDTDYRAAMAAYILAYQAYQTAGENGVLDPLFRQKAVDAANALIDAVATISGQTLKKAQ